jgi:sterol 24-C-methyltransferase
MTDHLDLELRVASTSHLAVKDYIALHEAALRERSSNASEMVHQYYNLVTDFYVYAWGKSFHSAPRRKGESLTAAIRRYEKRVGQALADAPGSPPNPHWLDLGCGVGGPMRTIAREFGARITGINIHSGQIERGRRYNRSQKLDHLCDFIECDFAQLPPGENMYDGAYSIEAICHASDRRAVYAEIYRVLKPGASFVGGDDCLTSLFDEENAQHRAIKRDLELGFALPGIATIPEVLSALEEAGFELVEHRDLGPAGPSEIPWHVSLSSNFTRGGLFRSPLLREIAPRGLELLEKMRLAPQGYGAVYRLICFGGDALVAAGPTGIFTPFYFFHARKPA